MKTVVSYDS